VFVHPACAAHIYLSCYFPQTQHPHHAVRMQIAIMLLFCDFYVYTLILVIVIYFHEVVEM